LLVIKQLVTLYAFVPLLAILFSSFSGPSHFLVHL